MKSFLKVFCSFLIAALVIGMASCKVITGIFNPEEPENPVEETKVSVVIKGESSVVQDEEITLSVKVTPEDTEIISIQWASSNEENAVVTGNGTSAVVTGVKGGTTAKITVTVVTENDEISKSKTISVKNPGTGTEGGDPTENNTNNNSVVSGATNGISIGTNGTSFICDGTGNYNILVWSDEFEGNTLKSENWTYELGNGTDGWGNQESQNYTSSSENSRVGGGVLDIIAKKSDLTSARIISKDLKYFKYGKIEARLKFDEGYLSWPAFWMLGQNMSNEVGWPWCGEIDIMEHVNSDQYSLQTVHWNVGGASNAAYNHGGWGTGDSKYSGHKPEYKHNDWNVFGMRWDSNKITMYVNDTDYFSVGLSGKDGWECFNKEFFILFNFAMGGQLTGYSWAPKSAFTGDDWHMYVDWVRVYQNESHTIDGSSDVAISNISISSDKNTLEADSTLKLTAVVYPSDATDEVEWSSSNTAVATVSERGVLTGVSAGTVTITAKSKKNASVKDTKTFTVTASTKVKVTSISVAGADSVEAGSTITLSATAAPSNATDKSVTWSSSDTSVATVSTSGVVTGVKAGSVTITATAKDGSGVKGTKTVTVNAKAAESVKVTSISVTGADSVEAGSTITLNATAVPSNATDKSVTWSSSNTSVATVSTSGVVTGVKAGSVTITATAKDGSGKKGTKTVTVRAASVAPSTVPQTITLNSKTYNYVWSDEFEYTGLPASDKWGYDVGTGVQANSDGTNPGNAGWGNGELQWYSNADIDNTYVSDGSLKIKAIRESSGWTSGRIVTRNIPGAQFKYGYIEMKAKIPYDAGVWPAFWMLDNDIYNGQGWPRSGEIDIMETSVNLWDDKVYGTLHCEAGHSGNPIITKSFDNDYTAFSDGQYHTYAVDWDDDHIDWYYDGVKQFTYNPSSYDKGPWPFNEEFYIIINLAVGGNLGRDVPATLNKSTMEIDYVRVYQKAGGYTDRTSGVPVVTDDKAPSTILTKSIPAGAKVIYDSVAAATNPYTSVENWNGTVSTVNVTLDDGKIVKRLEFSGSDNICGGWKGLSVPTTANSKLYLSVYASQNFKIEVNSIGWKEYTVPNSGTYSWVTVERDDLDGNTINQIGFLSDVSQKIFVDHVYVADSGNTGGEEPGGTEGGETGGETGGTDGAVYTVNLNTAVNGAWIYIDVLSSDEGAVNNLIEDSSKISNVEMTPVSTGAVGVPSKIDGGVRYGWGFANAEFHAGERTLKFTLETSAGSYDFEVTFIGVSGQNIDFQITSQSCTKK